MRLGSRKPAARHTGMTLIELVIVVVVIATLLTLAVPAYSQYVQRVHRSEAVRLLLQASMCQERIHASEGRYDSARCQTLSSDDHYRISFTQDNDNNYIVMAIPRGSQVNDPCGQLWMDQSGARGISASTSSSANCWLGR